MMAKKIKYSFSNDGGKIVLAPLKPTLSLESKKGVNSLLMCKTKNDINGSYDDVKSLNDENAQGKLSEWTILGRLIAPEELADLCALKIEKGNFQELRVLENF